MKISIQNLAKIEYANINIDGITIIAGNNNMGKSTIGKAVFTVINSLSDFDKRQEEERFNQISTALIQEFRLLEKEHTELQLNIFPKHLITDEVKELICAYDNNKPIDFAIRKVMIRSFLNDENIDIYIDEVRDSIEPVLRISKDEILRMVVTKYFGHVFHSQINNIYDKNEKTIIYYTERESNINLQFSRNTCVHCETDLPIRNEAIYIDNPFILDNMNRPPMNNNLMGSDLLNKLRSDNGDLFTLAFDELYTNEMLSEIYNKINFVIAGNMKANENGKYVYNSGVEEKELELENLSTGMKSFLILERLIQNKTLKVDDVVILDEPEIHLHPEWQLLYAEIIVMLQKTFHLYFIITTHSSHFLEAIDYYSKKYKIYDRCNYYLAMSAENGCIFENVTNSIEDIYREMISPSVLLDKLKYELDEENE